MSFVADAARSAFLDGGFPALVELGGGALRVALFLDGVECSGNGYARKTINELTLAATDSTGASKAAEAVAFTNSGGSIVYDQIKVFGRRGDTVYLASDKTSPQTINGSAHNVTISLRIPDETLITCATAAEIQGVIDNDDTNRAGVRLPASRIAVSSQILFDSGIGGRIDGVQATERVASNRDRLRSTLYWAGDRTLGNTAAMIRSIRADNRFNGFALDGATDAEILAGVVNRGPCAMEMDRDTDPISIGSGKWILEDVALTYWRTGIRLATAAGDGNCDESTYRNVFFDRCDVGVEANGQQTMEHHFHEARFRSTSVGVKVNAGGAIALHGGNFTHQGSVFQFPAAGAADNFGQNNASYTIDGGFKLDSQATGSRIVDMGAINVPGYYATFNLFAVHVPSPQVNGVERPYWSTDDGTNINDIDPMFYLSGNVSLNLWGFKNLQRGMFAWHAGSGSSVRINVYGGKQWSGNGGTALTQIQQLCNTAKSYGTAYVRLQGIDDYTTLTPLADYAGTVAGLL